MSSSVTGSEPFDAELNADSDEFDFTEELEASRQFSDKAFGLLLVILGSVAFIASMALSIEKYLKLSNPDHVASCSLNIFLDCTDAMASWQGALFGFPNPLIGVAAFSVVVTSGVVVLTGGKLPSWFWRALFVGTTLGFALIVFLIFTSIHMLGKLCPYCMVVWFMMFPLFWYQIVRGVQERYLPASDKARTFIMKNKHLILPLFYVGLLVWIALGMGSAIVHYIQFG